MSGILEIVICTTEKIRIAKIVEMLKKGFEMYGVQTRICEFTVAEKCLSYLEIHPVQLVFLGIETEDMDGVLLGEEIIFTNINKRPEIVYISTHEERVFDVFAVRPFAFIRECSFEKDLNELIERYAKEKLYIKAKKPVEKTFQEYLDLYVKTNPNKVFLMDSNRSMTAADVMKKVTETEEKLYKKGIGKGDYVALYARLSLETIVLFLSLQIMGTRVILTDPYKKTDEFLSENASFFPVKAVLTDEQEMGKWILKNKLVCVENTEVKADSKSPSIVIFTSGSTGKNKAVMLSQYNFVNNLEDTRELGGYKENDIALGFLPLNHVFGLALLCGALILQHTFMVAPGTKTEQILKCVETYKITRVNGIPELYMQMANQADKYDLHSLRIGLIGGSPCTKKQFAEIEERLQITLIPVYGMSECIGISCGDWKDSREKRMSGVGRFYPMNDGKIQKENGEFAGVGEEGEIVVDGPARMCGYAEENRRNFAEISKEKYLHTGDLGFIDENGILHITGRKKEILIRNGVNLSIRKIEEQLLDIEEISEAAVVGIQSEEHGEEPYAMVTCKDEKLQSWEIRKKLIDEKHLTRAELPAEICVVEMLPKTGSGKCDKKRIKKDILERRLKKWKEKRKENGRKADGNLSV